MNTYLFLSAVTGFFFAGIGYILLQILGIPEPFLLCVACGSLFSLLLFCFLVIHGSITKRKYAEFEKNIRSPVFHKTSGNFALADGRVRHGNIYFCEAGILCVSLDGRPHTVDEIPVLDIEKYQFDDIHLHISAKDGRCFLITLPDVPAVLAALREKDWI